MYLGYLVLGISIILNLNQIIRGKRSNFIKYDNLINIIP